MEMFIYVILYRLCLINEQNAMINLKNHMVKKHLETGRLKKNPAILALKKSGHYNERIRISFLYSNCSFGCLLTKKIGLTQFGAIEI